jgi:hypothetical protein
MKHINKLFVVLLWALVSVSCSDIYDNIKDFSPEERIYPARFDIVRTSYGYERVEFDFGTQGRVPASQMYLGKAKKTIVEYDDKRLVFDSICSWVNIKGLTESRIYKFKIYTEDQYGNPSIANEVAVTPFTSEDVSALALTPPSIIESTTTVNVEWRNPIESELYKFARYSYEYTDRNGQIQGGSGDGNMPNFFVENINKSTDVPVKITARVLPNFNNRPILDTIDMVTNQIVHISDNAQPVVFLKFPVATTTFDPEEGLFPLDFNWIKVDEAQRYVLKFSRNSEVPNEPSTVVIDVGDNDSYTLTRKTADSIVNLVADVAGPFSLYWTIGAKESTSQVNEQKRNLSAISGVKNINAEWTFDNPTDLFAAARGGVALVPVETGGAITSIAGPSATDKAIRIPAGSYLKCKHGLSATAGMTRVTKYSVIFDVRLPSLGATYGLLDIHDGYGTPTVSSTGDANVDYIPDIRVLPTGGITMQNNGWSSIYKMVSGGWSRVMLTVNIAGNAIRYYVDGIDLPASFGNVGPGTGEILNPRLTLDPDGCLLFAGGSDAIEVANVQFLSEIPSAWEILRLGGVGIRQYTDKGNWKIADASSTNANQGPSLAIDGLLGQWDFMHTTWPNTVPQDFFIIVDFSNAKKVSAVIAQGRQVSGMSPCISNFNVQISNDLVNWTLLGSNMNMDFQPFEKGEIYCDPSAPAGRYLKFTQLAHEVNLAMLINEIFIFGPK